MISFDELISEVSEIKLKSEELSSILSNTGNSLETTNNLLAGVLRGSNSGETAVVAVSAASKSVLDASASILTFSRICDDCVAHLAK